MIFDNPNVSNEVKLKIIYALLSESCKVDTDINGDMYLAHKGLCNKYLHDTVVKTEIVQQFITDMAAMLLCKYQLDIEECIKIQNEIIQLRADYPHLNIELGTFEPAVFDDPHVYTETANMILSLRERLHECLIDIGYHELNIEYLKTKE